MKTKKPKRTTKAAEIRRLIADYIASEGCECCRDSYTHSVAEEGLAKLLKVPRYKDGSGWDWNKYRSPKGLRVK